MKKAKTLWMPVLLGVLLLATLVGVAGARPGARPQQQAWRVLSVPAGHCIPYQGSASWQNVGYELYCGAGTCGFNCPVNFPAVGEQAVGAVNVKRLTMYAFDNSAASNAEATLVKAYPPTGNRVFMANVGTTSAQATDPQILMDTTIEHNPVYRTQGPYIAVEIDASGSVSVYGFFVHYTW